MRFAFAVRKLDGQLNEAIEQIGQCQRLYQKDGIHEPALAASLQATRESLESLRRSLSGIVAANERKFDMIAYLTEALKMEHGTVSELQSCLRVMPESPVRETLHRMLLEEKQHEEALVKRIVDLGGEPRVDLEIPPRPTSLSIADLLDQHRQRELATQRHYELGLSRFEEPEFQWILGQLNIEEKEHLKKLDELLGHVVQKDETAALVPHELREIRWVDPYMGEPGERPWIE